ncbi:hypothetical protein LPJ56_005716 [Coemansia sp. RSA 2599]|nr:hypothetical protein LPJ75_005708 [Coemansia sp. RSA 2598]KAJ1811782.1 hypothetical protein LPJ56_005716 [Coemansia sp. RSA 2599]
MSGPPIPPQTPIRYPQNQQQFIARPGQPIPLGMVAPGQQQPTQQHIQPQQQQQQKQLQRPGMPQFRPGMGTPQQQQMYMAGAAGRGAPVGMPQYSAQQQQFAQQHGAIGQPRPVQGIRPGQQQQQQQMQHALYTGNTNINIAGVIPQVPQPHPTLIQPSTPTQNRKRKSKLAQDTSQASAAGTSAMADDDSGDEVDRVQPYNISLARYQNNHNMMSEVFVALPASTIKIPKHFYEGIDKETMAKDLDTLGNALEQCEKEHEERIKGIKQGRQEFTKVVAALKEASGDNIDQVKRDLESLFAMEFVNNPYRTVDRVPISKIESVEGAVYRQL